MIAVLAAACCVVSGLVHAPSGTPISGAHIAVRGASQTATTTDGSGRFVVHTPDGVYQLTAVRSGFRTVTVSPLTIHGNESLDIVLEPADSPQLRTIGRVTVNGRLERISGAIPSVTVTRASMERNGTQRVVESLLTVPSLDVQYPHNAGAGGLATVSLRGPDPSETMVTLDGQLLNDANTGDVYVSQLPVAAFSAVDVSEGLGPQDTEGSSTIGGAVNLVSLRPTGARHSAFAVSAGSYGQTETWINTTGSVRRLGYAFAVDDQQEAGYVNETDTVCAFDYSTCAPQYLGSSRSQRSALMNLTYTFSENADVGARIFTMGDVRDQSAGIAGIDDTTGKLVGPGPQTFTQQLRAYDLHGRGILGAGEFVADVSRSDDGVDLTGSGVANPMYDLSHADTRTNESFQWGRTLATASFAVGGYLRQERFTAPGVIAEAGQHIAAYFARAAWQAGARVHLAAGVYASHYSTFGSSVDGRLSAVWDTDPHTSLRFSAGTGFRAPLLIERYVFPDAGLPPPDNNCVISGQGNPAEKPEHATEYELGGSHQFGSDATVDVALYRTNLRDPIENSYPGDTCPRISYSYPINVGTAVYEGAELRYVQRIPSAHMYVSGMYGLNVAYPENMPASVSNPTSGANIVNLEQFANIPQQQASLEADWTNNGWHASASGVFRGSNNPLNRPPVFFLDAAVGRTLGHHVDLTLAGSNLLNSASGTFQVFGGGTPYYGYTPSGKLGPIPTNLLTVEPASLRLILSSHF